MYDMTLYNKHYIRIREDGCIVDGFSLKHNKTNILTGGIS